MWPWEHLAVGYLLYSPVARARGGPPGDRETPVLAFGTLFPDLVDKTLGWVLRVVPGGLALAHSLLFAVPLVAAVLLLTRATPMREAGVAFGVGYLSHLPGDVLYPALLGDGASVSFLLWPLVRASSAPPVGVIAIVRSQFGRFVTYLATPTGLLYLALEVLLLAAAAVAWSRDGRPGLDLDAFRGSPEG